MRWNQKSLNAIPACALQSHREVGQVREDQPVPECFIPLFFWGGLDEAFGLIVGAVLAVGGFVRSANTQDHSASRNCDPCGESVGCSHGKLSYGPIDMD